MNSESAPSPNDDDFSDIHVTDAMRAYLAAFDDFLRAEARSDRLFARAGMSRLCDHLLNGAGLPPRKRSEALTTDDLFDPRTAP